VVDAVGAGPVVSGSLVVSGDAAGDRDGFGSDSVCCGASGERVGLGSVRVGDSDVVTDGRSVVPWPPLPPQAESGHSARTHRTAQ